MNHIHKRNHGCSESCCRGTKIERRDFMKLAGGGLAALLASQMQLTGASGAPAQAVPMDADLAKAYLKYLHETKGILDIRTIRKAGSGPNFLDVVVISAGFTADQMDEFIGLTEQLAKTLLTVQPWKRYQGLVNVHSVFVDDVSVDSTKLGVGGYKGEVLGCDDGLAVEYGRYAANSAATIVIHNSSFSTASNGTWGVEVLNKGDVVLPEALVHELGHGLAGLGDEYIQREGPFDEAPESMLDTVNVTLDAKPSLCKWHYWAVNEWPGIFGPMKLPKGVKLANFEGAGWPTKIYRPEETCLMRGDRNEFCVVCNETMETNFFRYINLYQQVQPAVDDLVLWKGENMDFRLSTIDMLQQAPEWLQSKLNLYLDGAQVASSDKGSVSFQLNGANTKPGIHQLGANLNIQAETVRRDFGFLSSNRGWRVKVVPFAKPEIEVKPLITVAADGSVDVPVLVKCANSPDFEVKMDQAPKGAHFENGRFKWNPSGATGSWRVDFSVSYERKIVASASMEIQVSGKKSTADVPRISQMDPVDAVTGKEVQIQLKAKVTDGGNLLFEPVGMPPGVNLNRYTGALTWVPDTDHAGPQQMRFRVKNGSATCEANVLIRVRRDATPSPVSFCNDYAPKTLEALKRLRENPVAYRRMFETLRLLRDRYGSIRKEALVEAKLMWDALAPALRNNCYQELLLHAWSFADRPEILKWIRKITAPAKSQQAAALISRLNQIDTYNVNRAK